MRDQTTPVDDQKAEATPRAIGPLGARRSVSADAAWWAKSDRIMAMTPRARMLLALSLKQRTGAFLEQVRAPSDDAASRSEKK